MQDLGTLPRDVFSAGFWINSRGDVIGASGVISNGEVHGYVLTPEKTSSSTYRAQPEPPRS